MKNLIQVSVLLSVFILTCGKANAQWGIGGAIKRGVERAVEKEAEEQVEKAIDKAFEDTEKEHQKGEEEAVKAINRLDSAIYANEMATLQVPDVEIPQVENTPYTPSESEWTFFAMKKGSVQTFAAKDDKGKITAQTRNTITNIVGSKNAFAIDYQSEMLDSEGKPLTGGNGQPMVFNFRVVVKDHLMYLDLKSMFAAMEGLEGVQASGTAMTIPNNLSVGQALPDASAKIKIGFINCTAAMTECKVIAEESVTTEAGTFRCYKILQKVNSSAMGVKIEGTTLTWYAKGIGAVKTETFDKKGKVIQTQEMIGNN
ncbi:MAG: hypothetical protein LBV02_00125 [Bacteroidales bacterium]|jgi:hypothetical protein|nr:hypothetical protein [Bacteroidales bacterium]